MGEVVDLGRPKLPSRDDREFVVDLARFAEAIRKKYRLADDTWENLGNDDTLVRAITDEKVRIRDGSTKREKAQLVQAPDILGKIMLDNAQSARHRIDSAKALNDFSANGPEGTPAADRFRITIVLNGDVERYDKSIAIDPNDDSPNNVNPDNGKPDDISH